MDIQSLIDNAKESLLANSSILPMLYLDLTGNQSTLFALDIISDTQSIPKQCGILARLGWEECKKHPDQQPVAIGCYSEAWQVEDPENDNARFMPVRSEKRREIITVQMWSVDNKPQSYALPIIRDHKKRVIDIGPAEGPTFRISWQVASFLKGCQDAQKPDDEVFCKVNDAIRSRLAGMSPDLKQKFKESMREMGLNPKEYL
jgi:hypothetical protein